MDDDMAKFLARVAQQRAAQAKNQKKAPPAAPPPARPAASGPVRSQPPSSPAARRPSGKDEVVEAQIVTPELVAEGDRVGREVQRRLRGSEEIAQRTSQLGKQVDAAQEKLQEHLKEVFDHELGRLSKTASSTAATPHEKPLPDVTLEELRAMLQSPQSVRDAIVVAEILRRPSW